jgi:hypothetical protein
MKSVQQSLNPYTTNKLVFYFYFPRAGEYGHFASNAAADQLIVARATSNKQGSHVLNLKAVSKLSVAKKETFMDILQIGDSNQRQEEVLEFLRVRNLLKGERGFNFGMMLWLLKADRAFFKKVLAVLRARLIYSEQVWAYAFYHAGSDEQACREYLMNVS